MHFVLKASATFFIALGVVLGGSLLGSISELLAGQYPLSSAVLLADRLKIWAVAAALGGTMTFFQNVEASLWGFRLRFLAREILLVLFAFAGAATGYQWIKMMVGKIP